MEVIVYEVVPGSNPRRFQEKAKVNLMARPIVDDRIIVNGTVYAVAAVINAEDRMGVTLKPAAADHYDGVL